MPKNAFLGLRVHPELKKQLQSIADSEERSISQVCEVLLRGGVAAYRKGGTEYLQRLFTRGGAQKTRNQ